MDPGLGGWWLGLGIGAAVVVVVVIVVVTLIVLARRIAAQTALAVEALEAAEENTRPLWAVATTNQEAVAVLEGAQLARRGLEGG